MFSLNSETEVGTLGVTTTEHRGHTIEEIAEMAINKIISISKTAPAPIKGTSSCF